MTVNTVGHQLAEQTAEELRDESFVSDAEVRENHKGPFVRVYVDTQDGEREMYAAIDQYPCYIDVVLDL